ncbi:FAD binding domain-containing protein [Ganoderma leucocontextum]|nr:FAD binding domain-containing protein [Ganoderma leucocontextum]
MSQSTVKESYVDVLIIGAGPSGVMGANALIQAGVNVCIVDKRSEGVIAGQADGCQSRTLEIMHSYDPTFTERLFRKGARLYKAAFYIPSPNGGIEKTSTSPVLNSPTARWNFAVIYRQGAIEDLFRQAMAEKGLKVKHDTVPTAMELVQNSAGLQDPNAYVAKVTLKNLESGHVEIVNAKFVLGSDGAHSWVRKTLGISIEGDSTDAIWGALDFVPDTDYPDFRVNSFAQSHDGTVMFIPREGDLIRLYIQQDPDSDIIDPVTGRADKTRTSPERVLEQAQKILKPYKMEIKDGEVDWWTVYVVGQRVATKYSIHERAFIAGDACHTHSPKAGQGMNAGMCDTHNLSWKITYVLRGWAPLSILKTYESERRQFAQDLIEFDKWWSKLVADPRRAKSAQDGATEEQFFHAYQKAGGFVSGIGIRYAPSPIVNNAHQTVSANLIVGERVLPQVFIRVASAEPIHIHDMLPADTRFKVLVFAGDLSDHSDRAKLQTLGEELKKPENFLKRYGRGDGVGKWEVFDMICFTSAKKDEIDLFDIPEFFRPHWTKVFLDDEDMHGQSGSGGYVKYGIDEHAGAIVVVRPDGYVGTVAPLDHVAFLNSYFAMFLL